MMFLRTATSVSLFALVLTGAIAAPITRPADGTLPPRREMPATTLALQPDAVPVSLGKPGWAPYAAFVPVKDSDITGSLGGGVRGLPGGELATLRAAIGGYEASLSAGDANARALADPAARALAEWIAIRTAPRTIGFSRISRLLAAYPNWPSAPTLRRRAEEALYFDDADAGTVRAFFAQQKPLTDEGKVALARVVLADGDRQRAAALIRDAYRNDALSSDLQATILSSFGSLLSRADLRFRADRLIYDKDYTEGLRAAARAGADVVALAKARIAVEKK